jgi:hypothetical protein
VQWQDWVFSVGGFVVLLSLVPTIRGDQKPALTTSFTTVVLMGLFAFAMATLGLWLSAIANLGILGAWAILAVQRYSMVKRSKRAGVLAQIEAEVLEVEPDDEPATVMKVGAVEGAREA